MAPCISILSVVFLANKQRHPHFCQYIIYILLEIGSLVAVQGDQSFDQSHGTTWNRFRGFSRLGGGAEDTDGLMSLVMDAMKKILSAWGRGVGWVGVVEMEWEHTQRSELWLVKNTPSEEETSSECIDKHQTCNDL